MLEKRTGPELLAELTAVRRERPQGIREALQARRRRPLLTKSGTIFLIAADHPARGVLKAGSDTMAMADRGELLRRLLIALERPGVDGVVGTPDLVEDLVLLGTLEGKLVFASMNRGGLGGSVYELEDRFTAYDAASIEADRLDGGKMMVRVADNDPGAGRTLGAAAEAISQLAERGLVAMVEVFASRCVAGKAENVEEADALIRAVAVATGLGRTSAYTWLKLPVVDGWERVLAASSLPTVLLGGDPGQAITLTYERWTRAMAVPQVVGIAAGRSILYPEHGDVRRAVDEATAIVGRRAEVAP